MKVFIFLLCLVCAFALVSKEDNFVGVVKGKGKPAGAPPHLEGEILSPPASASLPPPAPKEASENVNYNKTTLTASTTVTTNTSDAPVPPPAPLPASAPAPVPASAEPVSTGTNPEPTATTAQETVVKEETTSTETKPQGTGVEATTKTETTTVVVEDKEKNGKNPKGAQILNKLEDLKKRVEKLEKDHESGQGGAGGAGGHNQPGGTSGAYGASTSSSVSTANGPAPKVYDGAGVPQPGQIIGVSPFGVARPLVGLGAPDPDNKRKYNSVDVGKAKNTDHKAVVAGQAVAEQADQAHKDFLDENTEEFERVMSWLQEQQSLRPSHQPPRLLFEILKARIVAQEERVRALLQQPQVPQSQPSGSGTVAQSQPSGSTVIS